MGFSMSADKLTGIEDVVWVGSESDERLPQSTTTTTAVFIIYVAFKKASATAADLNYLNSNGQKKEISASLSACDKTVCSARQPRV